MRMLHVPLFHEGTFRAIVRAALGAQRCVRYAGEYWEPVVTGRQFAVYRRAQYSLAWIQERVEDYEFFFYRRLLHSHCGRDGALRPRSRLLRRASGAYGSFEDRARR